MILTNQIRMDLLNPGSTPMIHAVQNDRYCRNLEIALYSGNVPFVFPENGSIVIRYSKSDGKGGEYDTLPDGTPAWSVRDHYLTIALAPQVLTCPGSVFLSVSVIAGNQQLGMLPIHIMTHPVASAQIAESENYFYVTRFLPAPSIAEAGQFFRIAAVDQNGHITQTEAVDPDILALDPEEIDKRLEEYLTSRDFLTQEADPTVPLWAKQPEKPVYTASEVGALAADTKIPVRISDLVNDSAFITRTSADLENYYRKSETYTQQEINALVAAIPKFSISVVTALPEENICSTCIYLLPSGNDSDLYVEYIYANGNWETLGSQKMNLDGFATEDWVTDKLAAMPSHIYSVSMTGSNGTYTADKPFSEIVQKYNDGYTVSCKITVDNTPFVLPVCIFADGQAILFGGAAANQSIAVMFSADNSIIVERSFLVEFKDLPANLPNPYRLYIKDCNGNTLGSYNGTSDVTVTLPDTSGRDGYTPVRGTDYWTEADQETIVQQVITALGTPVFGTVDENNNIVLTGNLSGGTYTLKYEDAEGNLVEIGTLQNGSAYVNLICESVNADGSGYNGGTGWKENTRLNSSGVEAALEGVGVTGFMPVAFGDIIYLKNIAYIPGNAGSGNYIAFYDSTFTLIHAARESSFASFTYIMGEHTLEETTGYLASFKINDPTLGITYMRISCSGLNNASIVTKNEEIE